MAGDLFMGDLKGIRLLQDAFLQKEAASPFIEVFHITWSMSHMTSVNRDAMIWLV